MKPEERLLCAINALKVAPKGSLWFVKESVWKEVIPNYDQNSTRKAHAGLIFADKKYTSLHDTVNIMIGTSSPWGSQKGFRVDGVVLNSPKRYTYFRIIRPQFVETCPLGVQEFTGNSENIQRNLEKPSLNEKEIRSLNDYLWRKGVHL